MSARDGAAPRPGWGMADSSTGNFAALSAPMVPGNLSDLFQQPGAAPGQAARGLEVYRVRFEVVGQQALRKYCNADPVMFKNVTQTVPNSQIPDEDWHEVTGHETDNPWQQYNQLRQWESEDREFVRNVRLERLVSEPRWEAVSDRG